MLSPHPAGWWTAVSPCVGARVSYLGPNHLEGCQPGWNRPTLMASFDKITTSKTLSLYRITF